MKQQKRRLIPQEEIEQKIEERIEAIEAQLEQAAYLAKPKSNLSNLKARREELKNLLEEVGE